MTLADLLIPRTSDEEMQAILDQLGTVQPPFPLTAWQSGSAGLALAGTEATALSSLSEAQAEVAAGGYPSTATKRWLSLLSEEFFNLPREEATVARVNCALVASAGIGGSYAAGDLVGTTADGKLFTLGAAVTVPTGGAVAASFTAPEAGTAYNVANGAITTLSRSVAGLLIENWFGIVAQTGSGVGTVTPFTQDGAAPTLVVTGDVVVKITTGGVAGAGLQIAISTNDGISFGSPVTPGSSKYSVPAGNVKLWLSGTFVTNALYTFALNDSLSSGSDEEADEALKIRDLDRWPALGQNGPPDAYDLWAKSAEKAAGHTTTITRVLVTTPDGLGQFDVVLAGAAAPASVDAVADADAYIQVRKPDTASPTVKAASGAAVAVAATLYGPAGNESAAKTGAGNALVALLQGTGIGGTLYPSGMLGSLFTGAAANGGPIVEAKITEITVTTDAGMTTYTPPLPAFIDLGAEDVATATTPTLTYSAPEH